MITTLFGAKLAIVGGGKFCHAFLQFFEHPDLRHMAPKVVSVADIDEQAPGYCYARQKGIPITTNYLELLQSEGLEIVLELTSDPTIGKNLRKEAPADIVVFDHFQARSLWDSLQVERVKIENIAELEKKKNDPDAIIELINQLTESFATIIRARNERSRQIEMELVEHERTQSQIIQGSTIPTFVIDKNHRVTHWNRALEKLSGYRSETIVGTTRQWVPFWKNERPTMADVILGQVPEETIRKLYGQTWRKSLLIEGAYEAEVFFPHLGESGKWLWFTAAPIKAPDGTIIGAIETLWDKTEDIRAEEEREQHNRELSTLVSIYTALSAPMPFNERIMSALHEIRDFLSADAICIFLRGEDARFHLEFTFGMPEAICDQHRIASRDSMISYIAQQGHFTIINKLPQNDSDELCLKTREQIQSLVYIPISTKEGNPFGVIRIGSRFADQFSYNSKDILVLIGNRVGVAIENAMLQERYIRSEEKYRSLFNNDPNPIFIINRRSLTISEANQRAQDCYGYTKQELSGFPFLELGDPDDEELTEGIKQLAENNHHDRSILFSKRRHFKKGGQAFFVNINVSQAEYSGGDVLIASTTDITESVERETQLIQAGKMTTLGVMAAGMAHEINQPLNVIQVCADFFLKMLKRGQPISEADLNAMANDIVANVARAAGVIKHVRDFARQSDVIRSKVNINDPIQDVFKVLGHQIKNHEIETELRLSEDLPLIMAEHNRLEQVFINLVTNAIDAMDEKVDRAERDGGPRPEKRLTIASYAENANVVVKVTDTGVGMTKEVVHKIFEPFFTTKKTGKGTGLGISISYGIVKDYEGTIEIESEVGQGTTFKLSFPTHVKGTPHSNE